MTPELTEEWQPMRIRYNPSFLFGMKSAVPSHARRWDADDKLWYFTSEFLPVVEKLLKRHFAYDKQTHLDWRTSWYELHLEKNAPSHLIECASECLLANTQDDFERKKIMVARQMLLSL